MKLTFENFKLLDEVERKYLIDHDYYRFNEMLVGVLSEYRYQHSIEVAKLAESLAIKYSIPANKAYIAGILHDCTKEWSKEATDNYMKEYDSDKLIMPSVIHHQFTAYRYLKKMLNLDEDILLAIRNHTTGDDEGILSKIIYLADKCEPTRKYDNKSLRELAFINLNQAFIMAKKEVAEVVNGKVKNSI